MDQGHAGTADRNRRPPGRLARLCPYNAAVYRLRPYRPQDFERLLEIDQQCFVRGIAYSAEELRHYLTSPSAVALVAENDKNLAGFAVADRYRPRRTGEWTGHLITIDVVAEARRAGLGSQLLSAIEQQLRQSGCSYMLLEVAVNNRPALRFYERHGYSSLKALPRYYLGSLDGLLMGKEL